jgi:FSR family fosmidomycin resistance protein-like MFS transporter
MAVESNQRGLQDRNLAAAPVFGILFAIGFSHLLNDIIGGLVPAVYPLLKSSYHLSFTQVGLITLTYQTTSSLLQPLIGHYTDLRPRPFSLMAGMTSTLVGVIMLSRAASFPAILIAATTVGIGSSVFHPESSRVARLASGGQHGLAQSIFQVGGNFGFALGPLFAALIVFRNGQRSIAWFALSALLAMVVLSRVSLWYKNNTKLRAQVRHAPEQSVVPPGKVAGAMTILLVLIFSKYIYMASITTYFTFYLITKFHISVQNAQLHLFWFLAATAAGILVGGPVGDRIGRRYVIWCSILGVLPFTLIMPYVNLFWTGVLSVLIGLILSSAFSAILVFAHELNPGKIGTISGLFFGFAFGVAGVGAAVLGKVADRTSIGFVYQICSFLPVIGVLAYFLPKVETHVRRPNPQSPETLSEAVLPGEMLK